MAPSRSRDRDAGMRKISIATRMFAGAGIVLVGAFSAFLASRSTGSGSAGTVNSVTSPVATAPPSTLAPDSSGVLRPISTDDSDAAARNQSAAYTRAFRRLVNLVANLGWW